MHVLAGHRPNVAAAGGQHGWAPKMVDALNAVVGDVFLEVDVDALAALTDPAEPPTQPRSPRPSNT
jgi:hypothetical protein